MMIRRSFNISEFQIRVINICILREKINFEQNLLFDLVKIGMIDIFRLFASCVFLDGDCWYNVISKFNFPYVYIS